MHSAALLICLKVMRLEETQGMVLLSFSAAAVLVFGTAWLCSSLLRSPGIAAVCGLASVGLLWTVTFEIWRTLGSEYAGFRSTYPVLSFTVGGLCFVLGTVYYLLSRRP